MSKSTHKEMYNHENDDGPADPEEGDPYPHPRRRPSVRPATLVAAVAGVLGVAYAVGGVTPLPSGQVSGAVRPVAQVSGVIPRPRGYPRPASTPTPMPTPSARPSPTPTAKRKPVVRPARPASRAAPKPPPKPPPKAPAKAPPKPPAKAPPKPPVRAAPVSHQISGYVKCSTMAVEGVWIAAQNGGSGWAKWTAMKSASSASYSYSLPNGGMYAVHVGCGGSPADWFRTPDSGVVSGTVNDFICYDVEGKPTFDFCSHIS
jgi:hypothetical protein